MGNLSFTQVELLLRLDGGPTNDPVGIRLDKLTSTERQELLDLKDRRLIAVATAWRKNVWFQLTPAGRRRRIRAVC